MKKMSIKSRQAQNWLFRYNSTSKYHNSVEYAYAKPSSEKIKADKACQECCQRENGSGYKIISAGPQFFTVAWMTCDGNLRVETAYNSYIIKL